MNIITQIKILFITQCINTIYSLLIHEYETNIVYLKGSSGI